MDLDLNYYLILGNLFIFFGSALLIALVFLMGTVLQNSLKSEEQEEQSTKFSLVKAYIIAIIFSIIFGINIADRYGTHIEGQECDAFSRCYGGEMITDFEATQKQKNEKGIEAFFKTVIQLAMGIAFSQSRNKKW